MTAYQFLGAALAAVSLIPNVSARERIVSGNGAITEIVCALGAEDQLVAVDTSSVYPESAAKLPKIGYARQLSAEGVLAAAPTLVLLGADAGPPDVVKQIEDFGVRVVRVGQGNSADDAVARILAVGDALGRADEASQVAQAMQSELEQVRNDDSESRPKVLFIYARGGGTMNVSGTGTAADEIIRLAGGKNAVTGIEGFKPLTAEAAVTAQPDVILVTTRGLEAAGGIDGLLQQPGLAQTPAGKSRRIVAMDDLLLLGFGPRLGRAVIQLHGKLHPTLAKNAL